MTTELRDAITEYLDAERGEGRPQTGGFMNKPPTREWQIRMHRARVDLEEALRSTYSTDYQAIARLQSRKLQIALRRVEQLQDALRKALMDMPGAFLHRHVDRAAALCSFLSFDDVPYVGLHLTVTLDPKGEAVMVSWQDDEHRVVNVVWQRKEQPPLPTRPADTHH